MIAEQMSGACVDGGQALLVRTEVLLGLDCSDYRGVIRSPRVSVACGIAGGLCQALMHAPRRNNKGPLQLVENGQPECEITRLKSETRLSAN